MTKTVVRIAALMLCVLMVGGELIAARAEEKTTDVLLRIVWNNAYEYASGAVTLRRYSDAQGSEVLDELAFNVTRAQHWERHLELEPGFYQVVEAVPANEWREYVHGTTDVFEVRGDVMTVYCTVLHEGETPEYVPEQWVVPDKEDDTFYLWEKEPESEARSTADESADNTETRDPGQVVTGEGLNTETTPRSNENGSDVVTVNPPEKTSAKIGTKVFLRIMFAVILACGVCLIAKRKH